MKTAFTLATLGSLAYVGLKHVIKYSKGRQIEKDQQIQVPIQQLIKQVYLRISTKQHMNTVYEMMKLECEQSQKIMQPYSYTIKNGGKKIRLVMAVIMSEMFIGRDEIPKEVLRIGGLIEYLHSASLIIDDIEDQSTNRRGEPCSYLKYGLDRSINAANLMYFLPFQKFMSTIDCPIKKHQIFKIFVDEMTTSHMGQAQDVLVHKLSKTEDLPTFQQYEALTIAKTSSLLRMMARMMCVMLDIQTKTVDKLCQAMNYIGLAFQVTDDVLNLTKNLGKGQIAQDLRQKKFTPIIHLMRDDERFMQIFIQPEKNQQDIQQLLNLILNSRSVEAAKEIACHYKQKAQDLIDNLQTPYSKLKFLKLMKFIISREN